MNEQSLENFRWTKPKRRAAALLAIDDLTDEEIAAASSVSPPTLYAWKRRPEFQAEIDRLSLEAAERTLVRGIARREKRVEYQNERHAKLRQVVAERAADPEMQHVPGGSTGLLVRQVKQLGAGPSAQIIEEYVVDTGLLKEFREHEKLTAQEVGQWLEKKDVTSGGRSIAFEVTAIDYRVAIAALAPGPVGDSAAPSENQSLSDGSSVGQDDIRWRDLISDGEQGG